MTVGEMIARHHFDDARLQFARDTKAFARTPVGQAFYRFEYCLLIAALEDARYEYTDMGERSAKRAWVSSDKARNELRSLIEQLLRGQR